MKNNIYIIDTKLLWYSLHQMHRSVLEIFNEMSDILSREDKASAIYLVSDIGKSEHRLNLSPYYKGKRREIAAKKSNKEKEEHKVFQEEYIKFVDLCDTLPRPFYNVKVPNVEADDVASIIAYRLAKDKNNAIHLVTRDQDYLHSIIDHDNVTLISPYYSEDDKASDYAKLTYDVRSREEFTIRKALYGDDGDSILSIKYVGEKACQTIWSSCRERCGAEDITLDVVIDELNLWVNKQKTPSRYTIHPKYIEHNVLPKDASFRDVLELNYKLGRTMMTIDELSTEQQQAFRDSMKRRSTKQFDPFNDGIEIFGRPIILNETAKELYGVE